MFTSQNKNLKFNVLSRLHFMHFFQKLQVKQNWYGNSKLASGYQPLEAEAFGKALNFELVTIKLLKVLTLTLKSLFSKTPKNKKAALRVYPTVNVL